MCAFCIYLYIYIYACMGMHVCMRIVYVILYTYIYIYVCNQHCCHSSTVIGYMAPAGQSARMPHAVAGKIINAPAAKAEMEIRSKFLWRMEANIDMLNINKHYTI